MPPAQAIVVLGGSIRMPSGIHNASAIAASSDRILTAFRLYRAGKAPLILSSGGNNPLAGQNNPTPEAGWVASLLREWNVPSSAIEIEGRSISTRENAIFSYQALSPRGIRRILLVTSATHMPRAAGAFRKAGFEVIAVPSDFHSGWHEPSVFSQWMPSADNLVDCRTVFHEWLGIATYRLRHWM